MRRITEDDEVMLASKAEAANIFGFRNKEERERDKKKKKRKRKKQSLK